MAQEVDIFDFQSGAWRTLKQPIPTPQKGTMAFGDEGSVVAIGGKSARKTAHTQVEALKLEKQTRSESPSLFQGRYATQPVVHHGVLYLQVGSVTQRGTETRTMISLPLDQHLGVCLIDEV